MSTHERRIVTVEADRVDEAMRGLSQEDRALVELSVVRGLSDDEIASFLGIEAGVVRERRDRAVAEVAGAAGDGSKAGRVRAVSHLRGEAPPAPAGRRSRGSRPIAALAGGLVIAALVAIVLALSGRDADKGSSQKPVVQEAVWFKPLVPGRARGRAVLAGSGDSTRLRLRVAALPTPAKGGYVVWLYNSVSDARSLGGQLRGGFAASYPLPKGYERFRFIDISREPADGNRNHSGQSVLRLPLSALRG